MSYGLLLATVHLAAGGLILILGLVLLREHARNALNRVVATMLLFAGLGTTLGSSSFLIAEINPKLGQRGVDLVVELSFLWEFFFPFLLIFTLSYPAPHAWIRRVPPLRWLIFLPYFGHTLLVGARVFLGETFGIPTGSGTGALLALLRVAVSTLYDFHRTLYSLVNVAYVAASVVLLRRAAGLTDRDRLRDQLGTISWGMAATGLLYLSSASVVSLVGPGLGETLADTLLLAALLAGCGTIAYAMVRHRFLDATLLVRRAILYALSTALVVGLYLTVVRAIDGWIQGVTGVDTPVFQGLVLVVSLILYQPLLSKMEELLESVLLRDPTDYRTAVQRLSENLLTTLDGEELGTMVVDAIHGCLLTDRVVFARFGVEPPIAVSFGRGLSIPASELLGELPPRTELAEFEALTGVSTSEGPLFLLPLRHKADLLGVLLVGPKITGRRYGGEDRSLLAAMANQITAALKSAELHHQGMRRVELERDIKTARRIQRDFLPSRFPDRRGIDVFAQNVPSRDVGGDYYDVIEHPDGCVLLTVADVSGKGVPAALLASMIQASFRTQAVTESRPGVILDRLNRLVCASTASDQFATVLLARVDVAKMELVFANAGHNFPILLGHDGRGRFLAHSDLIVGVNPDVVYNEISCPLTSGDSLVLYTDGISEARVRPAARRDGSLLGDEGFLQLVAELAGTPSASAMVESVRERLRVIVEPDHEADDMTVLVARLDQSGGAERPATGADGSERHAGPRVPNPLPER